MEKLTAREGIGLRGKVTIKAYRAGMVEKATPYLRQIQIYKAFLPSATGGYRNYMLGRIEALKKQIAVIKADNFIRTAVVCPNLVMDSIGYGFDLIIQRLVGNNTYSLNLTFIEIGTGSTTPALTDVALTTPTMRAAVSFQEDYGGTEAVVQAYITDANLPNATYNEVGAFVDGTSSVGTGQIFNHALLSPAYAKSSGQDTTIEIDITIANA